MTPRVIDVPPVVADRAGSLDADGWLHALPALVAEIEAEWGLEVGPPFTDATEALVAAATTADGTEVVLKLLVPREDRLGSFEARVLRAVGGDGCVRILREDVARDALLLERLGPSLHDLGLPIERRHEILCDVASRVWRPAADWGLPTGAEKARWLVAFIEGRWTALGEPCSEAAVDHARRCAERREQAHDDERSVLVHGDVHEWNALWRDDGFVLVDPDGLLAEPEYDLGVMMREDPVELMADDPHIRARALAARTGLDAEAIWEWGVVERVSTGLSCVEVGLEPMGRLMLDAADRVAAMT